MRRPGVRFWRVVFVASVVLFVAGVAVTVVAFRGGGAVHLSDRTSFLYGRGALRVSRSVDTPGRDSYATAWELHVGDPTIPKLSLQFLLYPVYFASPRTSVVVTPAYYLPTLAVVTGGIAAAMIRRHKKGNAAGVCAGCGYALAGLPVDAAACPECGGKIGKSAAKAR
jgi:hypothetical protein